MTTNISVGGNSNISNLVIDSNDASIVDSDSYVLKQQLASVEALLSTATSNLISLESKLFNASGAIILNTLVNSDDTPVLMKLALTSPNKENYFNNPFVTFSNLVHAACYLEKSDLYGRGFTMGMYMWLTGQLISTTGPQCPISGNAEILTQLVREGIIEYPPLNDPHIFPAPWANGILGLAGGPLEVTADSSVAFYQTPMNDSFDYLDYDFQYWLARMEGLLAYEEKLGLKQKGVNSSSTVKYTEDGSLNVVIAYDKDFEDKMLVPKSIVFSAQTLINLIIRNKGLSFNMDPSGLDNMWEELLTKTIPGIENKSGFLTAMKLIPAGKTLADVVNDPAADHGPKNNMLAALMRNGWLVHAGICEIITKVSNSWYFEGDTEPSGNQFYDSRYAVIVDPSSGMVLNWNELKYQYNQPQSFKYKKYIQTGNSYTISYEDVDVSRNPIINGAAGSAIGWILGYKPDTAAVGYVEQDYMAGGPSVFYFHPPEIWTQGFHYLNEIAGNWGFAWAMHGLFYAGDPGPEANGYLGIKESSHKISDKLVLKFPWLQPMKDCTQIYHNNLTGAPDTEGTRFGCSFTFDPSNPEYKILKDRFTTFLTDPTQNVNYNVVPMGNINAENENTIYVGRELTDSSGWSVWNNFQNTLDICGNLNIF